MWLVHQLYNYMRREEKELLTNSEWWRQFHLLPASMAWESSVWTLPGLILAGFQNKYYLHPAWPELYSPCSVDKMRLGCIQTSFNATRHAGAIFVKYFLDDLCMKKIFQKFPMHLFRYESYQYSLGSRLDAIFCINSVLIQSGSRSCFAMNAELWRCCISAGGFSFLCDIRHSFLKISRHTEVWNTCSSLHLTGSMSCW